MTSNEDYEKSYHPPFSSRHPIPTIQKYREEKQKRRDKADEADLSSETAQGTAFEATENARAKSDASADGFTRNGDVSASGQNGNVKIDSASPDAQQADGDTIEDTSELKSPSQKAKKLRKLLHLNRNDRAEREVTDPVTHLPTQIHDFTQKDLREVTRNGYLDSSQQSKRASFEKGSDRAAARADQAHAETLSLFPPPNYHKLKQDVARTVRRSMAVVGGLYALSGLVVAGWSLFGAESAASDTKVTATTFTVILVAVMTASLLATQHWTVSKANKIIESRVWNTERKQGKEMLQTRTPETSEWLNSTFEAIWPLVNPGIFASLSDRLEDVMQASLPKFVRMVSVDDLGQGKESVRILGIKWLPTDPVNSKGQENFDEDDGESKMKVNEADPDDGGTKDMGGKTGDFVNMEIAFAYKARPESHNLSKRAVCMHLLLAFYLPSGVKLPVWVELHGIIGIVRVRFRLVPDPPFVDICTLTFLGQPKVDLSCTPIAKYAPDVMDIPLLSKFVQSSVDAAMSTYVAPKSISVNIKDILVGTDYKKDTDALGVLVVKIKRAYDFAHGDTHLGKLKAGSADSYVSVGWAKFGKRLWATRVIEAEMKPVWDEIAYLPVTSQEIDVEERLRVQLWDSDRFTADSDLGRFEIPLQTLMHDGRFQEQMSDEINGFKQPGQNEGMPGRLEWSVGYFPKLELREHQLQQQQVDRDINHTGDLLDKVESKSKEKLQELERDDEQELARQTEQDMEEKKKNLVIATPPQEDYPSGILSIQVHQIRELEIEDLRKTKDGEVDDSIDEFETSDLPSSYCVIMLNHHKIYRTRTKPKNSKPFINAGTERYVSDWRNAEILVSVRDARGYEDDPVIGVVHLPLKEVFAERAQIIRVYPLLGGIGSGRIRISMVFRSITYRPPRSLLGWEVGTVDVNPEITSSDLPPDYSTGKLRVRTSLGRGKFHSHEPGQWKTLTGRPLHLPVRKRYSSALVIELRHHAVLHREHVPAFAVLWLKDVVDDEETTVQLPMWRGDLKYATANCIDRCGEQVGTLNVTLRYVHGLSRYHSPHASKDRRMGEILEVLETMDSSEGTERYGDQDSEFDSSSSSSGGEVDGDGGTKSGSRSRLKASKTNLEDDGTRGPLEKIRDYKRRSKDLHRHERGIMQWKAPRTAHWIKHGVEEKASSIVSHFKLHDRDPTDHIEKEV